MRSPAMRSPLESRIAALRGRVRRLLALHGLSYVVGGLLLAVVAAGLADWLVHLAWEVRLAILLATIGLVGWLSWRFVVAPLIVRFGDLEIALRIEHRWPGLNDRLSSTVEFLRAGRPGAQEDDEHLGSRALREATVRQTLQETEAIDFRAVVDPRPAQRASALALAVLTVGLSLFAAAPELSRIALNRLLLGSVQWPKQTHLAAHAPAKVARGDPFLLEVSVAKGDRIPSSARVTYRFGDGETATEGLRLDDQGVFHGRMESVSRSFRFSVAAGDDMLGWQGVDVVPPPALQGMTIRLQAPAYTRLAEQTLAPGLTQIKAVVGTLVRIGAQANKPLAAATLYRGETPAAEPVVIAGDGLHLSTTFTLTDSAPFWFALRDTEGFRNREAVRYEVRAIGDEAPRVVIEEPIADRDVRAGANVPIQIGADDDFGLQLIRLVYKVAATGSEPTQEAIVPLWEAEGTADAGPTKHQGVRHVWDLSPLGLQPGALITFHADARDFDDLKGPNLGKSRELRLRIISDEEFTRQLEDQRRAIREEAERILEMQKQAVPPVAEARNTLEKTGQLPREAREELKGAEIVQRQVGSRITSRADGLDQKIRSFLDNLRNSKLPSPEAQKQMEEMQAGVEKIRDQNLGPAEQGLTRASKALDDPSRSPSREAAADQKARLSPQPEAADPGEKPAGEAKAAGSKPPGAQADRAPAPGAARPQEADPAGRQPQNDLAQAGENQKAIVDELQKMLEGLSQFETLRGVTQDAQNLLRRQEEAQKQSAAAAAKPDLMGKTPEALTPSQKSDLENLSNRQNELSRDTQNLEAKLNEMAQRMDQEDPLAAGALREAAEQIRGQGTVSKMGESADQLGKNQMNQARAGQEQARQNLKDVVDTLKNRRENDLARLVKELKNAEEGIKALREQQAKNRDQARQAQQNPDAKQRADGLQKLAKEQEEIQKALKKQLQRLQKLRADAAAKAGAKAAGKMAKAQEEMEQDQGDAADQDQEEALADLEEAQDEVKKARREAEEQLAMEQLAKMADSLKAFSQRQDKVLEETQAFEKARELAGGKLTRAQGADVRALGRVQTGLKEETDALTEQLAGAPVFALALKRAAEGMQTASRRLQALKTDADTQRAEAAAAKRFKQLLDALKPDPSKPGGGGGGSGGDGGDGGGGPKGGDGIPTIAQVKMLKALQQEVNERTDDLDKLRIRRITLSEAQQDELNRLQDDQHTIADLARDLTQPKRDDGEED
jgi:hypothetical protein